MTRQQFEALVSSFPYEKDVSRFPDDWERYAWPGNYRDIEVQFAWDVLTEFVTEMPDTSGSGIPDPVRERRTS